MYRALLLGFVLAVIAFFPVALENDTHVQRISVATPSPIVIAPPPAVTPVGITARAVEDVVITINPARHVTLMTKYELRVALHKTEWRGFINGSSHIENDVWIPDDRFFEALWNVATCGRGGDFIPNINVLHPGNYASDTYNYWRLQETTYDTVEPIDAITSIAAVNKWCD